MSGHWPVFGTHRPPPWTRRGRQIEMQNWVCATCGGRHAYWWHTIEPPSYRDRKKEDGDG